MREQTSTAATTDADPVDENASRRSRLRQVDRTDLGLLLGLPLFCLLLMAVWGVWRFNADLDAIEARNLGPGLLTLVWEHLLLTVVGTAVVVATAIPTGILLTRPRFRRFSGPVVTFANAGQAAPVIGLIVLMAMWLGFGFWTAVLALAIYAFLPVLQNTIVGLRGVDRNLVEAATGMGMTQSQALLKVEMPLAIPVIMVGVRTALVLLVGTASLATFISAGGLGTLIVTGITLFRASVLISGGLIIAVVALLVDWAGRVLEFLATPKGM